MIFLFLVPNLSVFSKDYKKNFECQVGGWKFSVFPKKEILRVERIPPWIRWKKLSNEMEYRTYFWLPTSTPVTPLKNHKLPPPCWGTKIRRCNNANYYWVGRPLRATALATNLYVLLPLGLCFSATWTRLGVLSEGNNRNLQGFPPRERGYERLGCKIEAWVVFLVGNREKRKFSVFLQKRDFASRTHPTLDRWKKLSKHMWWL